jgi:Domain of Unknown Function (DUF1259)
MSLRDCLLVAFASAVFSFTATAQGLDTAKIDSQLGRSGQKSGDVYKVGFPRTDLHVSVHGLAVKPGLALGSWAAFLGTDENAMVMGDLVLLESEITPVLDKLRGAGFEITAVHNHLAEETPHVMYVHYMGHGNASQLAGSLRAALAVSKTPLEKPIVAEEVSMAPAWVERVQTKLSRKGTFKGGVLAYGVPRAEQVSMNGMTIPPAAGVAQAVNFQAAEGENIATTGDFVLIAAEVGPVMSELRGHGIAVTALHSHMLTEEPRLFFMHFWAVGSAESVAEGIGAALKQIAVK